MIVDLGPFSEKTIAICHQMVQRVSSDGKSREEINAEVYREEPLPDARVLGTVLAECYEASFRKDEGRECCFSLVFSECSEPSFPRSVRIVLERDLLLNARELAAMSAVHAARVGALLWRVSPQGTPVIKEIVAHPPDRNDGTHYAPRGLRITCRGPGKIEVRYLMHLVATIDGSRDSYAVLGESIDPMSYVQTARWNTRMIVGIDLLVSMIERIRSHGHGGSIWVTDSSSSDHLNIKYPVTQTVGHRSGTGEPTPWQFLDQYGRLANTDGAALFNWQGLLLGFGVFGSVDKQLSVRVVKPSGDCESRPIEALGGARKQSAATFVGRHDGAAALVVSQDGQATLFHRDGADVVAVTLGEKVSMPW
jgi:hypothetical protein